MEVLRTERTSGIPSSNAPELPPGFLQRESDGKYVVRFKNHDGDDAKKVADGLEEAEFKLLKALTPPPRDPESDAPPFESLGSLGMTRRVSLSAFLQWYHWHYTTVRRGHLRTANECVRVVRRHLQEYLAVPLAAITRNDLERVLHAMRDGRILTTKGNSRYNLGGQGKVCGAIRLVFRAAMEAGFLLKNPAWRFNEKMGADNSGPNNPRHGSNLDRNIDYPSESQLEALKASTRCTKDRLTILLMSDVFLKECEAVPIRPDCFDFRKRTVAVNRILDVPHGYVELLPTDRRRRVLR